MKIKVNGTILDGDTLIGQNFSVSQIGEVSSRQGGFSNSFSLPRTSNNDKALGFPTNINTSSRSVYKKINASLIDGNVIITNGFLKIEKVTKTDIQITFFSDNTEWFQLVKDKNLVDLDLSDFDHVYSADEIKTAVDDNKTEGFTYTLIDYGEFLTRTELEVFEKELYPGIYVKNLVKQIFFDIGWKVEGSLFDDGLFNKMFLPFCGQWVHSQQWVDQNTIDISKGFDQAILVSPNETSLTYDSILQVNEPAFYDITMQNILTGGNAVTFFLEINGGDPIFPEFYDSTIVYSEVEVRFKNILINPGDTIDLKAISFVGPSTHKTGSSVKFIPLANTVEPNSTVQMSATLPDITQTNFLSYLFFSFYIIPQANNNSKTVRLDLFNDINLNKDNADDWSDKIDLSQILDTDFSELLNRYSSESFIKYLEDDNDDELSSYLNETQEVFGQGKIQIDNDFISNQSDIYTAPFSGMININSFNNTVYIPQIAYIIDGEREEITPKIGLLSQNLDIDVLTVNEYSTLVIKESNNIEEYQYFDSFEVTTRVDTGTYTISYDLQATNQTGAYTIDVEVNNVNVDSTVFPDPTTNPTNTISGLSIDPGDVIEIIITGTVSITSGEVIISNDAGFSKSVTDMNFCWFAKLPFIDAVDEFTESLAYDNILLPGFVDDTLKERFLLDFERVLNNEKFNKSYFQLTSVDINELDFTKPVYIDYYKAYFYKNKIKDYTGRESSTEVELIKLP